ncbi:cytochrome BD ubiquinol oxidase subunit I [Actinoplanes sp. SE50]|uniref:cytochrome ubiquinol oxidase subunit I n=1 Tax=unclassified Actinoplanes TaxID=2626549 RepID=UPI00023ED5C2|nr:MULTISPECIES: cytochrome ubiquinol oxidase subunit I [unclassified Actinoplanes]AEV83927.1 cytochrome bd-I oxidase subunit I [Actinoplanes sp. SE50/110]ATO81929.1 cytochrome BD ubiquinol oxidase subunit I [Actinoplanes sp. SE50]SLL99337.1 cytochrome BD ubiquinol oxidase subunit I [Actinoplanes sp. SE50/110]
MDVLDLTRLQFAVVTIYHYLFVPLSICLSATAAGLHLTWLRTRTEKYRNLTKFVGKLLIVTFAVGVVTGLVQEFQFGLGWSAFAKFYGDVFGPTLAVEGMLAFFLEATFLALWYFGWERLPRRIHAATIVVVAIGTLLSAYIILAGNSFMQNPVAYALDPVTGRARLTSFTGLLTNEVVLAAFPHTMAGAAMAGGGLLLALGVWRLAVHDEFRTLARLGAWLMLTGGALTAITGDRLGKVMTSVQPMKMAAAEALYSTTTGAPFSVFALGRLGHEKPFLTVEIPRLLSFLGTGSFDGTVQGIDDLQAQYAAQYGPGSYIPMIPVAFWTFRLMIGAGVAGMALAAYYLWASSARTGRLLPGFLRFADDEVPGWVKRILLLSPLLPAAANTFGWVFTETARQPWLAFGISKVADGISPGLTSAEVIASLAGFTLIYGLLAIAWYRLVLHIAAKPMTPEVSVTENKALAY